MKQLIDEQESLEAWLAAMLLIAKHYRLECSEETARVEMAWGKGVSREFLLERLARQIGLEIRFERYSDGFLDPWRLPIIVECASGQIGVVNNFDGEDLASVQFSGDQGLASPMSVSDLREEVKNVVVLRPTSSVPDMRVDEYIKPFEKNWFWSIVLKDWKYYGDIALASLGANVLALGGMIFSMQIYDRIVPAQSEPSLWVLFCGVMLAVIFEFIFRLLRTRISDLIGKKADLKISDVVFGHALRIRNDERSKSTGSFISQIRELEQVRELVTSTTIGVLADLPFFLFFFVVMWIVGGVLAWVPAAAIIFLVVPGLLVQKPLSKLSSEGMRESSIRNALLIESVQGIEDIKLLRAESRFQAQWNYLNEVSASIGMKQRFITGALLGWIQEVQSIVYSVVLLVGAYLVMEGSMTTGTLVGASILASRMLAPLAQLSGVFARWQQAKIARQGLEMLMSKPVDQPERSRRIHRPTIHGAYVLNGICFDYGGEGAKQVLENLSMAIRAGERIAVLGRNGTGKSTLLQLLAGMRTQQAGALTLDGLAMPLIDTADVRRDVGLLNQSATLFFGSVRDNLIMGAPQASDQALLEVLELTGALGFVMNLPGGLDYRIQEGGIGLSGGQRQTILLARTLICQPNVVLLDEPSAWLDDLSERQLVERLGPWLQGRTLVVATHRVALLKLVERIVVLEGGKIILDGPRDAVLARLAGNVEEVAGGTSNGS